MSNARTRLLKVVLSVRPSVTFVNHAYAIQDVEVHCDRAMLLVA